MDWHSNSVCDNFEIEVSSGAVLLFVDIKNVSVEWCKNTACGHYELVL